MKLFKRNGFFFIPITFTGWLILGIAVATAVYFFIDIDSRSHSVSDSLMSWVFNCLIIAIVYSVIGFFTQESKKPG
ncbi:MAG: hypothetical protein ABI763_16680 [Bacteroidota bacterium]